MGGSGAKIKRKQRRKMEGDVPPTAGPPPARRGSGSTTTASTNPRPPPRHRRYYNSPPKNGEHSRQKNVRRNDNNTRLPPQQKKKKFQKPKHLKRKLDSVDDEAEKAEILRQIETFEQKKRQRVELLKSTSSKMLGGTGDRHSLHKQEDVEEDFARSSNATKETESSEEKHMVMERGVGHHGDARRTKSAAADVEEKPRRRRGRKDLSKAAGESTDGPKEEKRDEENNHLEESRTKEERLNKPKSTTVEESSPKRTKPESYEESKKAAASALVAVTTETSATIERKGGGGGGDDEDDDDSDTDSSVGGDAPQRQRGKKRRGRRDTSKIIKESVPELKDDPEKQSAANSEATPIQQKPKNQADRRCIGRKPVTDFQIGQSYPGKVVYVKPFGVFLDIGCHSDAFCHVSRLRDDFVESPEALFQPGDPAEARVLEIDRKKKRITVSMQSEARMEDERASMEARQIRREKHKGKTNPSKEPPPPKEKPKFLPVTSPPNVAAAKNEEEQVKLEPKSERTKPEAELTPAELKRARKLARRAARREQGQVQ